MSKAEDKRAEELARQILSPYLTQQCADWRGKHPCLACDSQVNTVNLAGEWRDIESEPRDGSDVLMVWPDGHVQIAQSRVKDGKAHFWFENSPVGWLPLSILPTPPTRRRTVMSNESTGDKDLVERIRDYAEGRTALTDDPEVYRVIANLPIVKELQREHNRLKCIVQNMQEARRFLQSTGDSFCVMWENFKEACSE